ncbi:MAG: hypothetical protein AABY10_03120 [Nanoarchaeota archaeon]
MESENITMQKMYNIIVSLKREVEFIKNHMAKEDMFLTPLEEVQLEETLEAHKKGKTISLEDFKKELGD